MIDAKLVELSDENVTCLKGKAIYCVRFYADYLDDLYNQYSYLPMISGAIEGYERLRGVHFYRNYEIPVIGFDDVNTIPKDSILLITSSDYLDEYNALCEALGRDGESRTIYYFLNRNTRYYLSAIKKYDEYPLENIVVFRSGPPVKEMVDGLDYSDNARSLFEYMVENGFCEKYKLVWVVADKKKYNDVEKIHNNVIFLEEAYAVSENKDERELYYHMLCQAKYIFFTEANGFCRLKRNGQIRVQLWHGCGYKKSTMKKKKEPPYEYMPVVSKLYAQLHAEYFKLRPEQMIVTGYPKQDWLFHPKQGWKEKLGIPDGKRIVIWLPTFRTVIDKRSYLSEPGLRKDTDLQLLHNDREVEELDAILSELDTILILKLHPIQEKGKIRLPNTKNIFLVEHKELTDNRMEINHVLGDADALISDYSSAAVDFLALDRPMAFAVEDVEQFKKARGFIFDPIEDYLPGELLYDYKDMIKFIKEVGEGKDLSREKRRDIGAKLNEFHDDKNCERLLQWFGI